MGDDFAKICRTCLSEVENSKPLFIEQYINEEPLKLADILAACASIQVNYQHPYNSKVFFSDQYFRC